jgi:hypothetical protein
MDLAGVVGEARSGCTADFAQMSSPLHLHAGQCAWLGDGN